MIDDLLVQSAFPEVADRLLQTALTSFLEEDIAAAVCWLPSQHPSDDALQRAGFINTRAQPGVTYRAEQLPAEELEFLRSDSARIHFMLGDSDHG